MLETFVRNLQIKWKCFCNSLLRFFSSPEFLAPASGQKLMGGCLVDIRWNHVIVKLFFGNMILFFFRLRKLMAKFWCLY